MFGSSIFPIEIVVNYPSINYIISNSTNKGYEERESQQLNLSTTRKLVDVSVQLDSEVLE